jgi:hypothetical protein
MESPIVLILAGKRGYRLVLALHDREFCMV